MKVKYQTAIFLDKASLYPDDLDFSALEEVASWQWFDNVNPGDIQHVLENAEILVTNKVMVNREVIESSKRLGLICVAATGVNNVDLEAAEEHGVSVCNVRGYATSSVAQHVFSLMLALNRKLFSYRNAVISGKWSRSDYFCYFGEPVCDLENKTLGIIGYGELGRAVAKIAKSFAMKVLVAHSHKVLGEPEEHVERVDLTTLLATADVVSLHCPLTETNRHMIAEAELAVMKADALLINTARGGLIDEQALLSALLSRQIGGVALDVLEQEPPPVDHPLLNYHADNLIITPHIAWASRESRQRLVNEIAKNIQAYQQGVMRNIV